MSFDASLTNLMRITAALIAYVLDMKTLKLWSENVMYDICLYNNAYLRACFTQYLGQISRNSYLKTCREVKLDRCASAREKPIGTNNRLPKWQSQLQCGGPASRVR